MTLPRWGLRTLVLSLSLFVSLVFVYLSFGQATAPLDAERMSKLTNPKVADYIALAKAMRQFDAKQFDECIKTLEPIFTAKPLSPLRPRAAELAVRAALGADDNDQAVALTRRFETVIAEPQLSALRAKAAEGKKQPREAALAWNRVYYGYPGTPDSATAESAIKELRTSLGAQYPQPTSQQVWNRIDKLISRRDFDKARQELIALTDDRSKLRTCSIEYRANRYAAALNCLRGLELKEPDLDAERLFWLAASFRQLDRNEEMIATVVSMSKHAASSWRNRAVFDSANGLVVDNDVPHAQELYQVCTEIAKQPEQAAECHWKYVWLEWMKRAEGAPALLREHIARYHKSDKVPAALYFLGEYAQVLQTYPTNFYATLARGKLNGPTVIAPPAKDAAIDWAPRPQTQERVERAKLLAGAQLQDLAIDELRFAGKNDPQPQGNILAYELAQIAAEEKPEAGIRAIKAMFGSYITLPLDAAPPRFWELAFPLAYRSSVEREAKSRGIDSFLLASLIRQESEWDHKVISPAHAYGLMQLLPSTAAEIARRAGVLRFSRQKLFDGDVNITLGTYYFSRLINQFDGKVEPALASYNGGATRVKQWLTRWDYKEPAEFVESIPLGETRNYILLIRRNEDFYRRIYARSVNN